MHLNKKIKNTSFHVGLITALLKIGTLVTNRILCKPLNTLGIKIETSSFFIKEKIEVHCIQFSYKTMKYEKIRKKCLRNHTNVLKLSVFKN